MKRLCFLEGIDKDELIFSMKGKNIRIPIKDQSIVEGLVRQLEAGETLLLEVDLDKKELSNVSELIELHDPTLIEADDLGEWE
ncbi:hypothetical protein ABC970_20225 [Bacillus licheniformis]|uniref:hypothetical protein n=1 Tax=Bacillus TaxID=1386 RepID=UPI000AEAA2E1|nr:MULTISPECIES: hypothetical protein [Bacillus]MCD2526293.1 hypothetical protein [Bacillus licheniformis]MDE1397177.1 hypothetical protein [Bacillus licheniformis]PAC97001.1 hypothetical protein CHH89_19925 [Bacillus licheniformis]PAE47503.1 hypothetical protein CHH94_09320 [Bacillus licheniformis]TWN77128.1 hypothetical protein CHCC20494_1191 [Bacillus licheniformis]